MENNGLLMACLHNAKRLGSTLDIYLVSGIKLRGKIKEFNNESAIVVDNSRPKQLVFFHCVSTIVGVEESAN